MLAALLVILHGAVSTLRTHRDLLVEVSALRQQLAIYKRTVSRPKLRAADRLFWMTLRHLWSGWRDALVIVKPETVIAWQRSAFRRYWSWISRRRKSSNTTTPNTEIRELVRRMALDNPTWGAPRVHGELRMLGVDVSERTVSRYLRRFRRRPQARQNWLTFLRNHRDAIAAFDFFVVFPTAFRPLYVWFVIEHARRRILHVNVTGHPTSAWVIQNLREAFPYDSAPRYLIFDRDSIFSTEVAATLRTMGIKPVRTAFR
jgi:putative transposase